MEAQRPAGPENDLPGPVSPEHAVAPEPVVDKPQALSFAEGAIAAEAIRKQPVIAFERSYKAGEMGEAREGELERKEIKDEPGATQTAQEEQNARQAVSIGSVIADMPSRQPNLAKAAPSAVKPPADSLPASNDNGDSDDFHQLQPGSYSQAIKVGFFGAVALIIVFILFTTIT